MQQFLEIMLAPFVECLILVGIHSYLGIHVLKRRVIFVDLSLAQIAALGTTVGILFGIHDTESQAALLMAMTFTVGGAAVFALTRIKNDLVPQEAIIGLVYAITAAVAVLVVEKTHGVEHLVNIMHGRLLWVRWDEVAEAAALYAVLGLVHYVFRKPFLAISEDPEGAFARGMRVRLWDFFFYVTFGLTISMSVKVAGVLLVFVFLVAPAVVAFLVTQDLKKQLLVGWVSGFVVTSAGLSLSWVADMPSGPMVVSLYGVVLALAGLVWFVVRAGDRARALKQVAVGAVVLVLASGLVWQQGRLLAASSLAGQQDTPVFGELGTAPVGHHQGDDLVSTRDQAHDHADHRPLAEVAPEEVPATDAASRYRDAETAFDRLEVVREAVATERIQGLRLLYVLLADGETPAFCRSGAVELVRELAGTDFGFDPDLEPLDNLDALDRFQAWMRNGG